MREIYLTEMNKKIPFTFLFIKKKSTFFPTKKSFANQQNVQPKLANRYLEKF